jgi:deoxyribose-phosphate aldolase
MIRVEEIAKMIDHSLLKPNLTESDLIAGIETARKYGVASVCIVPWAVPMAKKALEGTGILVTTVIGFPHGTTKSEVKLFEAEQAIGDGAVELDMVININKLLSGDYDYVGKEIEAITSLAHQREVKVKVILENCYLTDELKAKACMIAEKAGADFVKTSTGYGTSGAVPEDVRLMRSTCSKKVKVKAAGGIRKLEQALVVIEAGAERFGCTATGEILEEASR